MKRKKLDKKIHLIHITRSIFWFSVGAVLGLFLFISFVFIFFEKEYADVVYPGVSIEGISFGGKSKSEVINFFNRRNEVIGETTFVFQDSTHIATASAKQLKIGYDSRLLAQQAYDIGRSDNIFSNIYITFDTYINGISLSPFYRYSEPELNSLILPIANDIKIEPTDALFNFENGRVTAFKPSLDGQEVDINAIKKQLEEQIPMIAQNSVQKRIAISIPTQVIKPKITTDKVNNYGIKELIGMGTSLFQGSIPNRVYNVSLAASRINGVLVAPGEEFSFDKALGDVSSFTGYKQAYVIQNGKTILGDGGGICQVSTTFFRALLNAGLLITERHAHAYRVHYYEEDAQPGIDATVYTPTVDLKFRNDTGHYILIQNTVDPTEERLTFYLYGTKDGREVKVSQPVIKSQTPAPQPLYQDDPTLPKGVVKQVDFEAAGAYITFTRQVYKEGKLIINDTFVSNFQPWQAVFLRGTAG